VAAERSEAGQPARTRRRTLRALCRPQKGSLRDGPRRRLRVDRLDGQGLAVGDRFGRRAHPVRPRAGGDLHPDRGNRLADVAASDARTGRLLWHSPPGEFTGWPTICPDDQTEICLTGALVGHAPSLPLRFDARNGDAAASARAPYSGRELGPNLFDAGGRSPEHLVATRGTSILWTKRLSTIFAAGWASSDNGWNFERNDRLGLFVGSVGPRLLSHSGSRCTLDLSTMKTVAFAIRDGAVAWRRPGSSPAAPPSRARATHSTASTPRSRPQRPRRASASASS
jgi:hypothetical protein